MNSIRTVREVKRLVPDVYVLEYFHALVSITYISLLMKE